MAKVLGYGGIANTNGARDFTGRAAAAPVVGGSYNARMIMAGRRRQRSRWYPVALGALLRMR